MDNTTPPVDPDGMPVHLAEADFYPEDVPCPLSEATCEHSAVEIGHGMAQGRFSNGNEYVEERCVYCGAVFNAYWTGGVL